MISRALPWKLSFDNEEKRQHLHIYYSDGRAYSEKQELKQKIKCHKGYLNACVGRRCYPFGPEIERYFYLHYEKDGVTLKLAEENDSEIENSVWQDISQLSLLTK